MIRFVEKRLDEVPIDGQEVRDSKTIIKEELRLIGLNNRDFKLYTYSAFSDTVTIEIKSKKGLMFLDKIQENYTLSGADASYDIMRKKNKIFILLEIDYALRDLIYNNIEKQLEAVGFPDLSDNFKICKGAVSIEVRNKKEFSIRFNRKLLLPKGSVSLDSYRDIDSLYGTISDTLVFHATNSEKELGKYLI